VAEPPPDGSPAAILTNMRHAVVAKRSELLWAELQELPDAVRAHTPQVATARDTLSAAINLALDHGVSSSCTGEAPRGLTTTSIDRRLGRHHSLDPLVAEFVEIVQALRPLLAKAHLGEAYRRRKKSLQAYSQERRLSGTAISPEAVLHETFKVLLENDELLLRWEFPRGKELTYLIRDRVDKEGHNRQRRHATRKRTFRPLDRPKGARDGPGPGPTLVDPPQSGPQEASVLAEELLAYLTPLDRKIVEMCVAGFSNVEIGRELGICRKTIPARYERALREMRVVIEAAKDPEAPPNAGAGREGCVKIL
jgi:DNA-directed RNA polymerase specialized sigma24 family protein